MNQGNFYEQLSKDICITHKPGLITSILHRALEKNNESLEIDSILEIGGNVGEHLPFVKHKFKKYIVSDLREIPINERTSLDGQLSNKVFYEIADCQNLQYEDQTFDRVIITCVLHHIPNLEKALHEIHRIAKLGGQIDILLPCDPGMLYRISRQLTSLRIARKLNKYNEAKIFHAREHRNHFDSIITLIKSEFDQSQMKIRYWPFKFKSWNFEVFATIRICK